MPIQRNGIRVQALRPPDAGTAHPGARSVAGEDPAAPGLPLDSLPSAENHHGDPG
jgi:hypothetical protein